MTNYERLFKEKMKNPRFSKAYYAAWNESRVQEMLEELREKISRNEPKSTLLRTIASIERRVQRRAA
jgi:hypothetical protein